MKALVLSGRPCAPQAGGGLLRRPCHGPAGAGKEKLALSHRVA